MEMTNAAKNDAKLGPTYKKMVHNILHPLKAERVMRIDVDFYMPETTIDTVIGRAAHIEFIDNELLTKMIIYRYGPFRVRPFNMAPWVCCAVLVYIDERPHVRVG